MSALELAAELARLHPGQRRALLEELPPPQRDELSRLIDAMRPAAAGAPSAFAQLIDELTEAAPARPRWRDDPELLARLLVSESAALRGRLRDEFGSESGARLTPHVRSLVADHLERELQAWPGPSARAPERPRWQRWIARLRRPAARRKGVAPW